jgi:hypothetical protein
MANTTYQKSMCWQEIIVICVKHNLLDMYMVHLVNNESDFVLSALHTISKILHSSDS